MALVTSADIVLGKGNNFMVTRFYFTLILISLLISSTTVSYSPAIAKTQFTPTTVQEVDRQTVNELLATFEQAEHAMQSHDLDGIMDVYADKYAYHGLKKSDIKAIWSKLFQHYKELESIHTFSVIRKGGSAGNLIVEITCTGVIWGTSKQNDLRTPVDSWYEEIHYLTKENGRWRIIGHASGETEPPIQFGMAPHPLF
jgi:ketosteroid isomerase-like protein